ncbi:transporter substrate-binding domain-containing protein [Quadrisphaera sp. INWT6]|uniref:transporter substrate-binding domain-containing protein n=1 Tax=Quadrisphaera sp. INWT6 TaxID=2596917 RepID=UPI0018920368|nr:transporter substrate-binding domain-containing protein [Quadrisphaera sp. INWT6]MBF5082377.1 transporter substrate-binding domain-containing protein [Quadrisphaera sp. INWT6]
MQIATASLVKFPLAFAAAAALISVSACGGSGDAAPAGGAGSGSAVPAANASLPAADPTLAAMLPQSLKDKGTITVAAAVYAPAVMVPEGGGAASGWDIQITNEAAALLGLQVEYAIIPFDGVIPGLQAGRYDAATGEINVTDERTQQVTFVVNHVSQDAVLVKSSAEQDSFASADDFCGLKIGAAIGSSEAATAEEIAKECTDKGQDTTVSTFQTQALVNLALSQGRIDANIASSSQVAYSVDQSKNTFKLAEMTFGPEIQTGLALPNNADTAATAKAFQAATDKLIADGRLQAILDEFNGGQGAVTTSEIVPAPAA